MSSENSKIISIAPGRICLFGDHQDYLGLPIIACAIDRFIKIEGVENNKKLFVIHLPDINKTLEIPLDKKERLKEKGNHYTATLKVLERLGCVPNKGFDITLNGNIPINSGLSSSSAVVVAWANFLVEAFGIHNQSTPSLISQIAYEAEVLESGGSGGKMDQYSIGIGDIIYLETDKNSYFEKLKVPEMSLIIGESGVPKATDSVLKEIKEKSLESINIVKNHLPYFEISTAKTEEISKYIEYVPENLKDFFIAAISNHSITQKAFKTFKNENFNIVEIANLMNEHHAILRDNLKLTVPIIDAMIEAALKVGALGAKIVGSGRGGSIVAISKKGKENKIIESLKKAGAINAYQVSIVQGAYIQKS